jgi:hypothetical protein
LAAHPLHVCQRGRRPGGRRLAAAGVAGGERVLEDLLADGLNVLEEVSPARGLGRFEGRFEHGGEPRFELLRAGGSGLAAAVGFRVGPLEQPRGGPPVGAGGGLHDAQRVGGRLLGELQLVIEVFVVLRFTLDSAGGNADDFGGFLDGVAARDEIAEFGLLLLVERAATAADVGGHGWLPKNA